MGEKTAIIIGAGPAGLTAAYELLTRSDIKPIILEQTDYIGGISRTAVHNGNRIDIGGHRFFSKDDRVMNWWLHMLPMEHVEDPSIQIMYQGSSQVVQGQDKSGPNPEQVDRCMLVRSRKSRIYWGRRLFDYPLTLSTNTLRNMGIGRAMKAGLSYLRSSWFPIRPEQNLEEFFINRFGRQLYRTFFKSYTEKVWGVPCHEISAEWGAQRIKGLSITRAIKHAIGKAFKGSSRGLSQKQVETSLIERFLYPKFGPGQMWEVTAEEIKARGGSILLRHAATGLRVQGNSIVAVKVQNLETGQEQWVDSNFVFSSMPVNTLVRALGDHVSKESHEVANGLMFRDFFTVGLLVNKLKLQESDGEPVRDNWIYIQEPDVLIGRLQIFNNWSPYLVADKSKFWLGLEYFCYDTDPIWTRPDPELIALGTSELDKIGIIDRADVTDGCVFRMKKTYPAYFGSYNRFDVIKKELSRFSNLFCVGRNGQHHYNNQDHSMLTAMVAVDNIIAGHCDKATVWDVNTERNYHEEKK